MPSEMAAKASDAEAVRPGGPESKKAPSSAPRKLDRKETLKIDDLDTLEMHERVGQGAFATVARAVHIDSGREVAVKTIAQDDACVKTMEVELNRRMLRRNDSAIAKLRGDMTQLGSTASKTYNVLVFDFLKGGSLRDLADKGKLPLSDADAKKVARKVLRGVKSLHAEKVVHCDLKLDNICLNDPSDYRSVKIVDLGLATDISKSAWVTEYAGTPKTWAPEIVRCYKATQTTGKPIPFGPQVDLWSVGVIMYEILSGRPPFDAQTARVLFNQIEYGKLQFEDSCWQNVDPYAIDLIQKLLEKDASRRISAKQALLHPWLNDNAKQSCGIFSCFTGRGAAVDPPSITLRDGESGRVPTQTLSFVAEGSAATCTSDVQTDASAASGADPGLAQTTAEVEAVTHPPEQV